MPDDPQQNVEVLFAETLKRPITDVQISEDFAQSVFQSRLKELHDFTDPALPRDIVAAFNDAERLTSSSHQRASEFVRIAELLAPLEKLSERDLFGIAFREQYNTAAPSDDRSVTREVYEAIMEETTGKPYREILIAKFAGRSEIDKITAGMAAILLIERQHTLFAVKSGMLASARLGLICRGILYLAVIQKQGSRLRKTAVQKSVTEIITDMVWELLSHTPPIAEFVGPFRIAMKLIDLFSEKNFPLDELHAKLKTSYGPVNEFISAYNAALSGWSEWATGLAEAMRSMIKTELPAFDQPPIQTT